MQGQGFYKNPKVREEALVTSMFLCRYYIPNCTAEDVMRALVKIIGFKNGFRSSPCNIMKKRAFYYAKDKSPAIYDVHWYKDEFNHYYEEYQDYFKKNKYIN